MNINTFFLDKLLAGEQSLALGSKKVSSPTYLFSDIIKVFEQEGEQNSTVNDSASNSNLTSQNILQLPVNVIECNGAKLQALSQFIDAFMADPKLSVKATEVKHNLQSVVINKKQFLLSSGSFENFINGLIQNLGLNNSSDLKTVFSQNTVDKSAAGIVKNLNAKSDEAEKLTSEKETDNSLLNNGTMVQSLLHYLSENKSLSLSIKNGKDKLNINFYTLPEENIEAELNLEKLSADFNRSSKELNAATSRGLEKNPADFNSSSLDQNNLKVVEVQSESVSPVASANPIDLALSSKPNDSVYKTEVIEITFNPNVQPKNLNSTSSASKVYQLPNYSQTDPSKSPSIFNSSSNKNEIELFDADFRLGNNFSAQLNALQNTDKNVLTATSSNKSATSNSNPLLIQQSAPVVKVVDTENNKIISADNINSVKQPITTSLERKNVIKEVKVLLNDLKGTLESPELTKSSSQKDKIVFSAQSLEMKKDIAQGAPIASSFNNENTSGTIESPKAKVFTQEVKDVLMSGMVSQKITGNDEKTKVGKDADAVKSISDEKIKNDKVEVKDTHGKSSEEKEFAQNKSNENFKNVLLSSDQTKSIDTDKLKIMTEAKQINEPVKVIKPTEIIPEFSKIIQAGEKQSMTFQLTPENLGKIKLIVDLVENQISTRIEVENDQVKQFIQSNIEQLKQNLQSSGVHLSNVNVSLAESEQKFAKTFTQRRKMGEKVSRIKEGDDTTRRSQKSLGYNTYEYLA